MIMVTLLLFIIPTLTASYKLLECITGRGIEPSNMLVVDCMKNLMQYNENFSNNSCKNCGLVQLLVLGILGRFINLIPVYTYVV